MRTVSYDSYYDIVYGGIAESVPRSPRHFCWVNGLSSLVTKL